MTPLVHLIISIIIAAVLFPFYGINVYLILIGGVLIDLDHLIVYYLKFRKLDLSKSYGYFSNKKNFKIFKGMLFLFHNVEFFVVLVALSFLSEMILLFTIGVAFHYILDFIFEIKHEKALIKNYSIIYEIVKKIRS